MSIPLPPSESKGMSMREYQRIYPHALSQQTLTESRMVHRALLHRLHKDHDNWKSFYRWQRVKSYHKQVLFQGTQAWQHLWQGLAKIKSRLTNYLLQERPDPLGSTIHLKLPRKVTSNSSEHPVGYRF